MAYTTQSPQACQHNNIDSYSVHIHYAGYLSYVQSLSLKKPHRNVLGHNRFFTTPVSSYGVLISSWQRCDALYLPNSVFTLVVFYAYLIMVFRTLTMFRSKLYVEWIFTLVACGFLDWQRCEANNMSNGFLHWTRMGSYTGNAVQQTICRMSFYTGSVWVLTLQTLRGKLFVEWVFTLEAYGFLHWQRHEANYLSNRFLRWKRMFFFGFFFTLATLRGKLFVEWVFTLETLRRTLLA